MGELELFLQQYPQLRAYQKKLEIEMNSVPEEHRTVIVAKHIAWNLQELETELKLLQLKLINIGNIDESNS